MDYCPTTVNSALFVLSDILGTQIGPAEARAIAATLLLFAADADPQPAAASPWPRETTGTVVVKGGE